MAGGFTNSKPSFGGLAESLTKDSGVGAVFSTRPTAKYASGARTVIKINGKPVAFAFGITWNVNTRQTQISTIDDYLPYEYAPQMIEVDGTISGWHIPGDGPAALDIQSNILSFLFHRYITIEVRDSATDALLFKTSKAVITSKSETINTDSLAQLRLNFKAIGWQDEKTPAFPSKYKDATGAQSSAATNELTPVKNFVKSIGF